MQGFKQRNPFHHGRVAMDTITIRKVFRENEITAAKKPPVSYLFDCDSANPLRRKGGDSNNKIMSANLSSKVISATIFLPTSSSRLACLPPLSSYED